jgi:hypothetical protein
MCVAQLAMGFAMPFQKGRIGYCATFCVLCVARECSRGRFEGSLFSRRLSPPYGSNALASEQ